MLVKLITGYKLFFNVDSVHENQTVLQKNAKIVLLYGTVVVIETFGRNHIRPCCSWSNSGCFDCGSWDSRRRRWSWCRSCSTNHVAGRQPGGQELQGSFEVHRERAVPDLGVRSGDNFSYNFYLNQISQNEASTFHTSIRFCFVLHFTELTLVPKISSFLHLCAIVKLICLTKIFGIIWYLLRKLIWKLCPLDPSEAFRVPASRARTLTWLGLSIKLNWFGEVKLVQSLRV